MRIENLLKIIDAELTNAPSVSFIDQVKLNASEVKRADAFVCIDKNSLNTAIQNGAYAIIYQDDTDIADDEIAWVKVENIKKALIRYLRYKTVQSSYRFFYTDDVIFQILKKITIDTKVKFLDKDIFGDFKTVINADSDTIFVSNDPTFVKDAGASHQEIEKKPYDDIIFIDGSLFRSDLIIDGVYYKNLSLPSLFIDRLKGALEFLKSNDIKYDIANIYVKNHFEPIFVDRCFKVLSYGASGTVLIIENDINLIKEEVEYLQKNAKYAKNCLFLDKRFKSAFKNIDIDIYYYDERLDVKNLKDKNYNFFLILQREKDDILEQLLSYEQKREKKLF
ncbi:MAG: hypothetical protein GXO12_03985 [Epsilonproteobacteria bacterium]|nr:hypothetical protein [Campylobacterota bacterium]